MTDAMLGVDADNPTGALGLYEGLGFAGRRSARSAYWGPAGRLIEHAAGTAVASWRSALEDPIMRSYLIVANQTLTSRSLNDAITARLADGPVRTHVVVPLSPVGGRLTWDEQASRDMAQTRLDEVLARLREMGAEADGEIGDRDPVMAVRDALRGREVDEVIVSTLPQGVVALAGRGRPEPAARLGPVPVTVVTQEAG